MRSPLDPDYVLDQYEAMRREALEAGPHGPRGHGLALFLSRGMPAWLAALSILGQRHARESAAEDLLVTGSPELAPAVRSELTLVWAGMVLDCSHERAR
ncbi:MAG: hypothetical protein DMG13_33190 [Acidobacteria bacterium]|jgi:hypothetical protein|nr:MAG: hypothetical protein DMG13_33190 [Acidobacteriota bacterium]